MHYRDQNGNDHWIWEFSQAQLLKLMGRAGKSNLISSIVYERLKTQKELAPSDLFLTDEIFNAMSNLATLSLQTEKEKLLPQPNVRRHELLRSTTKAAINS